MSAHWPRSIVYQDWQLGRHFDFSLSDVALYPLSQSNSDALCQSWPWPPGCFQCLMMWPWLMWPLCFHISFSLDGSLAGKMKECPVALNNQPHFRTKLFSFFSTKFISTSQLHVKGRTYGLSGNWCLGPDYPSPYLLACPTEAVLSKAVLSHCPCHPLGWEAASTP